MGIKLKILILIFSLLFLFIVRKLVSNKNMRPTFSILWFSLSVFLISIPIFESSFKYISTEILGLTKATDSIYIFLISFLLMYSLYTTVELSRIASRVHILISSLSIVEKRIRDLEDNQSGK